MTTTAQIIDWIAAHTGECIDRTGLYGAQAPDLVNAYAGDLFGLPYTFGHGKDVTGNLARLDGWGEVSPDLPAQLGDVFSALGDGIYGNCGLVVRDLGDNFEVFTQNNDGTGEDPAALRVIPKSNVIGYARPPLTD